MKESRHCCHLIAVQFFNLILENVLYGVHVWFIFDSFFNDALDSGTLGKPSSKSFDESSTAGAGCTALSLEPRPLGLQLPIINVVFKESKIQREENASVAPRPLRTFCLPQGSLLCTSSSCLEQVVLLCPLKSVKTFAFGQSCFRSGFCLGNKKTVQKNIRQKEGTKHPYKKKSARTQKEGAK